MTKQTKKEICFHVLCQAHDSCIFGAPNNHQRPEIIDLDKQANNWLIEHLNYEIENRLYHETSRDIILHLLNKLTS